jgi:hypothetical protein
MYLQHTDTDILVPQHISKKALYSAQCLIILSGIAFIYEYYKLFVLLFLLYISSILHWSKVLYKGLVKTIDIILAFSTIITITFYDINRFCPVYQKVWYYTVTIISTAFITNEVLFYYQVLRYSNKIINRPCKNYWYFSLEYTNPNTYQRELSYYRNTYTHMVFVHILPPVVSGYCGIKSYYTCPPS